MGESTAKALEQLFSLEGRVAVVTGASAGLGIGLVRALGKAGARVVLAARRLEKLEALADELANLGIEALPVSCDIADSTQIDALVETTRRRFGGADILVNNAGITKVVKAEEDTQEDFRRVVDVNLNGLFHCTQGFGRLMLDAGRGSIVNIASVLGFVGAGTIPQAAYAASKGAVVNLTRELAAQWARRGVRVNGIAPGWFESEMTGEMFEDERSVRWIRRNTPMGRAGTLTEFEGAVIFLASDASSYVTGQTLAIDGGWSSV
jgi:NAD(P)-dependent dehydrogenase (short-subunit alcohol dehydrogenase family)